MNNEIVTKKCTKCSKVKNKDKFYKHGGHKDGLSSTCKCCTNASVLIYNRTKKGLVVKIYTSQIVSSKRRKMDKPTYSNKELKEWLYSQELFHKIYDNWKRLDFQSDYIPSVDRKYNDISYTIDNIQIMTWKENRDKYQEDKIKGNKNGHTKEVIQMKNGTAIDCFFSIKEASRKTGINKNNIGSACRGRRILAGGYGWEFK